LSRPDRAQFSKRSPLLGGTDASGGPARAEGQRRLVKGVADQPGGAALDLTFREKSTGGEGALYCNQVDIFSFLYFTMEWFLFSGLFR